MKNAPRLPDREKAIRIEATTPGLDAWVSANAGSGKTTILRNRVIRLLLDGVAPDRILCLTFTKAAAAEMHGRNFAELARWVALDDAALTHEIALLVTTRPEAFVLEAKRLALARTLFARAIEAPGGLKIQTIHAFAERVLHLFPLEAGVPLDFTVLGEADAEAMRHGARQAAIDAAITQPASPLGRAFGEIVAACGTEAFAKALDEALAALSGLAMQDIAMPSAQTRESRYRAVFGVPDGEALAGIEADFVAGVIQTEDLRAAADAIRAQKPLSPAQADRADDFVKAATLLSGNQLWREAYLKLFLTDKSQPRKDVFTKPVREAQPHLNERAEQARDACVAYLERRRAFSAFTRSLALLVFAEFVLSRFVAAKRAQNALDFDDLIAALRRLLHAGQASWMMMKLDASIEHVLIDEAQDTTRAMWDIVRGLTEEFFAGEGRARRGRSIFVVGDEKQSIFSFQGADPAVFEESRQYFAEKSLTPGNIRTPVALNYSFRSSDDILRAVDAVFASETRAEGLTASGLAIEHVAAKPNFPGLVEIWPTTRPPDDEPEPGGAQYRPPKKPVAVLLAERMAEQIAHWLREDTRHLVDGRPIRPGDIVILVQRRNAFFSAMLRALKLRKIPVAGADRLKLQDEIVIRDFLAIAEAVLLKPDDLTLATVLKSPLFGVAEPLLEALARHRTGSLWDALHATAEPALARMAACLDGLAMAARAQSPFEFFTALLIAPAPGTPEISGRQAILTRLGVDVGDPIDAFLSEAQEFSRSEPGSVLLFVLAQRNRETVIKRDLEHGGNRVRVMTVHGAKGLEGRVVFLGDTTDTPKTAKEKTAFVLAAPEATPLLVWAGAKKDEPEPMRAARRGERRKLLGEYRRLLYVGMTRAADRLYIGGYKGKLTKKELEAGKEKTPPADPMEWSWYELMRAGFADLDDMAEAAADLPDEAPVRRMISNLPPAEATAGPSPREIDAGTMPDWLRRALPAEALPLPPLRPSKGFAIDTAEDGAAREPATLARRRGIVLHQLYEWLPRVPPAMRRQTGLALLVRLAPELAAEDAEALLLPVIAMLETPEGRRIFGPETRAEVAITGRIALPDGVMRMVSARIDRLIVGVDTVEIIDLKTGKPRDLAGDAVILRQMALYRAVLQAIYPAHRVRCAVLWTETGAIDPLPDAALDAALRALSQT